MNFHDETVRERAKALTGECEACTVEAITVGDVEGTRYRLCREHHRQLRLEGDDADAGATAVYGTARRALSERGVDVGGGVSGPDLAALNVESVVEDCLGGDADAVAVLGVLAAFRPDPVAEHRGVVDAAVEGELDDREGLSSDEASIVGHVATVDETVLRTVLSWSPFDSGDGRRRREALVTALDADTEAVCRVEGGDGPLAVEAVIDSLGESPDTDLTRGLVRVTRAAPGAVAEAGDFVADLFASERPASGERALRETADRVFHFGATLARVGAHRPAVLEDERRTLRAAADHEAYQPFVGRHVRAAGALPLATVPEAGSEDPARLRARLVPVVDHGAKWQRELTPAEAVRALGCLSSPETSDCLAWATSFYDGEAARAAEAARAGEYERDWS